MKLLRESNPMEAISKFSMIFSASIIVRAAGGLEAGKK